MLFVNAGTTNRDPSQTIGDVSTEEFYQVMLTSPGADAGYRAAAGR
jgi:hypothetical protein